ncbi:MAG: response regulator [Alphaproteobacteria bacterium]|nr:response regulator [Alphaproteobacteria bacterium]
MTNKIQPGAVNVLVIEDDEIDVEMVRRAFKKSNLQNRIYHARCGADALAMLCGGDGQGQEKIPLPCVMLVDMNMPQMNGIEFLEKMRREPTLQDSPAFVLSTSKRSADVSAAYAHGISGYFLKENVADVVPLLAIYLNINHFPL